MKTWQKEWHQWDSNPRKPSPKIMLEPTQFQLDALPIKLRPQLRGVGGARTRNLPIFNRAPFHLATAPLTSQLDDRI